MLAAAACSVLGRARRPERAKARAVLSGLTAELDQPDDPVKAERELRNDRAKFDAVEAKRTADHPQAQDKLTASHHGELQQIEKGRALKRQEPDKKIAGLSEGRRKALRTALAAGQSAYERERLGRWLIAQNPPHGTTQEQHSIDQGIEVRRTRLTRENTLAGERTRRQRQETSSARLRSSRTVRAIRR
ncbi:hypothetical protein IPZ68_12210 [Streptomyces arenae]|nr:hypothetical protein [Streptomyces arenae]